MGWGTYRWLLAEQGIIGKTATLATYRSLYRGDAGATYQALLDKFLAAEIAITQGYQEARRNFPLRNELRNIIDARVQAMPKAWEYKAGPEAEDDLAEELNGWAAGPYADRGRSLYAMTSPICHDQELDGNAVPVMAMGTDGIPRVALRDSEQMALEVDLLTQEPKAIEFAWGVTLPGTGANPGRAIQYVHKITADGVETMTADGKTVEGFVPGQFQFLPAVIIPRNHEHGSPIGKSGVAELAESYLDFLWAAYLMNVANKYEAFGVYTPKAGVDVSPFYDSTGKIINSFQISPGCFYPLPLDKVGGGINIDSIREQYDRAEATLYRLGKVKRNPEQSADMRSGKAMVVDSQAMREYVADKLTSLRIGLERIADMYCWAMGRTQVGERCGLVVEFDLAEAQDPEQNFKRADLWLKARMASKVTQEQMLRAWQRLDLIDEDADIEKMAEESEGAEASMLEQLMEKRASAQPVATTKPGNGGGKPMMPAMEDMDETEGSEGDELDG